MDQILSAKWRQIIQGLFAQLWNLLNISLCIKFKLLIFNFNLSIFIRSSLVFYNWHGGSASATRLFILINMHLRNIRPKIQTKKEKNKNNARNIARLRFRNMQKRILINQTIFERKYLQIFKTQRLIATHMDFNNKTIWTFYVCRWLHLHFL